jgi:peptidoglycan/xylan/chitin deacetylase (PgdA/CDA1 family)
MYYRLKPVLNRVGLTHERVAAARMLGERTAMSTFGRRSARSTGRILCYHSFGQPMLGVNDVTPNLLRTQIETALTAGYRFVEPAQIARTGGGPMDLAVTFDDAWTTVATAAVPILQEYGIPSTLFVVSGWCDDCPAHLRGATLGWRELDDLMNKGVEIGSHSATHADFGRIGHAQAVDELEKSWMAIERNLGFRPRSFAIPLGQSANWTDAAGVAAREAGYDLIYAQAESTRPQGTIPRTFVTKFDRPGIFKAALGGVFDSWEEWI